jgi:hypothetical protein
MYTPPSPPGGDEFEEAMRLQAERLEQLTINRDAREQGGTDLPPGCELLSEEQDAESTREGGTGMCIPVDSPAIRPAVESGRRDTMVEFYSQRTEPDLASCYMQPNQTLSGDGGRGDTLDSEPGCQCQVCGRLVLVSELEDHQVACQMSRISADVAVAGGTVGELTICDSQPLCLPPRPTIAVHRVQYDAAPAGRSDADAHSDMSFDTVSVRGRARRQKKRSTKSRR